MCIYGIKFTGGFDDILYFNDPNENDITAMHLDNAGSSLCSHLWFVPNLKDPYQEVVISIGNNIFMDLFIICCENCQQLTEQNWRIHLKSQFLIHRYAIVQSMAEKNDYLMAERVRDINQPKTCITEDYRQIPVTGNNGVCFTYGKQKFINPVAGQRYMSKLENILRMGQYNATVAKYSLGKYCSMSYALLTQ
ncbi:hypothetical protein LOAG_18204, partial [Loa loa]|uniref:Ricin B-type lectin domain-containing protein n=1 Tax=Loa loa TaxID=7209 RepID=A0A1I7V5V2_LOALO